MYVAYSFVMINVLRTQVGDSTHDECPIVTCIRFGFESHNPKQHPFKVIGIIQGQPIMKMLAVVGGAGLILANSFFALATCTGRTLRAGGKKKGPLGS